MEDNLEKQTSSQSEEAATYVPRPAWQVWCARIALVLFILIVIGQILRIARGGF